LNTCLLSFSGGLDSLACAIKLKEDGYDVTLGHISWLINGTNFGEAQTVAAYNLAEELGMPLEVLAYMGFPETSFAKYSWVPVCISTIMHHAGDPCEYPAPMVRRYDSVAFGTDFKPDAKYDNHIRRTWLAAMKGYAYDGMVLFPLEGMERSERAALIPKRQYDMTVCCYLGSADEEGRYKPCGVCWKCTG
jgi:7-cyano-7-deazaguanine synthase in queuosine biosynthesis